VFKEEQAAMNNDCKYHDGIVKDIAAIRREMDLHFSMHDKSIESAKVELDRRLAGMNEFREQLDKQAREFVTRNEIDFRFNSLNEDVSEIRKDKDMASGADKWTTYIINSLIGLAVIIVVWFVTHSG
jgi:hypothetical protein